LATPHAAAWPVTARADWWEMHDLQPPVAAFANSDESTSALATVSIDLASRVD